MPIYQLLLYWSTTTFSRVFETDAVLLDLHGDDAAPLLLVYRGTAFNDYLKTVYRRRHTDTTALDQFLYLSIFGIASKHVVAARWKQMPST